MLGKKVKINFKNKENQLLLHLDGIEGVITDFNEEKIFVNFFEGERPGLAFNIEDVEVYPTDQDNEQEFHVGQNVLYVKTKDHIELGVIVSFNSVGEPFVLYHTGDTAACTPKRLLQPIFNDYAFIIERVNCRDNGSEVQEKRNQAKSISLYRG